MGMGMSAFAGTRRVERIRVLPVPRKHPYVEHIRDWDARDGIVHASVNAGGWSTSLRSPLPLEPGWLERHWAAFDLLHVHFGFRSHDAGALEQAADRLAEHDKPLVYTVHDLSSPRGSARQDAQTEVLLRRADALITLTPGAARTVANRCGRMPHVLPHPHVVPLGLMADLQARRRARRARRPVGLPLVGLHLDSLPANMAAAETLQALLGVAGGERFSHPPPFRLRIDIADSSYGPRARRRSREVDVLLGVLQRRNHVELHVHRAFGDEALFEYLNEIDVSLLPYATGTHSRWIEACRDLGTAIVAPRIGYFEEQGPMDCFRLERGAPNSNDLRAAITAACERVRSGAVAPIAVGERAEQRRLLAQAHREIYEGALSRPSGRVPAWTRLPPVGSARIGGDPPARRGPSTSWPWT